MTPELLFYLLSFTPGPFWLGLMFFPRNQVFQRAFDVYLWVLLAVFSVHAIPTIPAMVPLLSNPTFDAVHAVFQTPLGFVSGWNHFILGDLWFGRYIAEDSHKNRLSSWIRAPLILLTLYFGPLGLFTYLVVRTALRRNAWIQSREA